MNKRTAIRTFLLGAAVLLAGIFTACQNPAAPSGQYPGSEKRNVQITVDASAFESGAGASQNVSARNLMPETPVFSQYVMSFTPNSGQADVSPITITPAAASQTVSLLPGDWTIEVLGYVGDSAPYTEAAWGSVDINVGEGDIDATVTLAPLASGPGTFTYNVTYPAAADSVELKLASAAAPSEALETLTPVSGVEGSVELDAGYYVMTLTLKNAIQQAGAADLIRIYPGQTTSAVYEFANDDFVTPVVVNGTLTISSSAPASISAVSVGFHSAAPDYLNDINFGLTLVSTAEAVSTGTTATTWTGTWSTALNPALFGENIYFSVIYTEGEIAVKGVPIDLVSKAKEDAAKDSPLTLTYSPPPAPSIAGVTGTTLTVSWPAMPNATGYQVYYHIANDPEAGGVLSNVETTSLTGAITGLSEGVTYYVWIKAKYGSTTWSNFSAVASAPTIPAAPGALTFSRNNVNTPQYVVSWTPVTGAAAYEIYYSTTSEDASPVKLENDPTSATVTLTPTELASASKYYFRVKAKNVSGVSGYSPEDSFNTIPTTPTNVTVIPGFGCFWVSWTASEGATGYQVWTHRTSNAFVGWGGNYYIKSAETEADGSLTYTIPVFYRDLANKTPFTDVNWYFRVRAVNSGTPPTPSETHSMFQGLSEVHEGPYKILPAPSYAVYPGNGEITLTPNVAATADTLWVHVDNVSSTGLPDTPLWTAYTLPISESSQIIGTELTNFTEYYVYAKAGTADGSLPESVVTGPITVIPGAPGNLSGTAGTGSLNLSWDEVTGTAGYEVRYGITNNPDAAAMLSSENVSGQTAAITTDPAKAELYYVWVTGKNGVGVSSDYSAPLIAKTIPKAGKPTLVSANASLAVTWTNPGGATKYELKYGTTNDVESAVSFAGNPVTATSAAITGLDNFTLYYVWVRALNDNAGTGDWSEVSEPTAPGRLETPPVVAPNGNGAELAVSWAEVSGATGYEVWYDTVDNSVEPTQSGEVITGNSTTITGLTSYQVYYVWIKVVKNEVKTPFSPAGVNFPVGAAIRIDNNGGTTAEQKFYNIGAEDHPELPASANYILDVDLTLEDWTGIAAVFQGKLDGNNKTITLTNFAEESLANTYMGIFREVAGRSAGMKAEIKDLTIAVAAPGITDSFNNAANNIGILAGRAANAQIKNVTVSGGPVRLTSIATAMPTNRFGTIAGWLQDSVIDNATVNLALSLTNFGEAGGVAGRVQNSQVLNSKNQGNISFDLKIPGTMGSFYHMGGVIGYVFGASALVDYCVNTGDLTIASAATLPAVYSGGLIGRLSTNAITRRSYTTGDLTLSSSAGSINYVVGGGIVGTLRDTDGFIEDCYTTGNITVITTGGTSRIVAGGILGMSLVGTVTRCYANGKIECGGTPYAAGILGWANGGGTAANNAALNSEVNVANSTSTASNGNNLRRVAYYGTTHVNNIASKNMALQAISTSDSSVTPLTPAATPGDNGLDCDAKPAESVFSNSVESDGLGWDFSTVWVMGEDGYPALRGFSE